MDNRTKRQKLQDMANQTVSPEEAEIAKKKLAALPEAPYFVKETTITFTVRAANPEEWKIFWGFYGAKPSGY